MAFRLTTASLKKVTLLLLTCVIATSQTAYAASTYTYRALNNELWFEPGCETTSTPTATPVSNTDIDKITKVLIPMFDGGDTAGALAAIQKYKFGGMAMYGNGKAFDKAFFDNAKSKAGEPFVPMADEEGGNVSRYGIEGSAASQLGQMNTENLKNEGQRVAGELKKYGIEVDFAPVLDIDHPELPNNHLRDKMGGLSRAFSADTKTIIEKAGAFAEGLSAGGVIPTYKHFPGLGQAPYHSDDRAVTLDFNKLGDDLKPFQALANQNSGMVMLTNAKIIGLGGENGVVGPMNTRLIEKLRGEIGFGGTIITDDLSAIAGWKEGSIDLPTLVAGSLKAGADLALFKYPGDAEMDKIIEKIKGDVPTERTDEAYGKFQSTAAVTPPDTSDTITTAPGGGGGGSCSCDGGVGSIQLAGIDNLQKILNFFMSKGLTLAQAAGIAGNMQAESTLRPDIIQGGGTAPKGYTPVNGVGFGLVQWTFTGRQGPLVNYTKQQGVDITDLGGQLGFAWQELNGPIYKATLDKLKTVTDPVDAAIVVHGKTPNTAGNSRFDALNLPSAGYEASGDSADTVITNRGGNAQRFYDQYKGAAAISGSSSSDCSSGGGIMSADCSALVSKFKQLRGSKLTDTQQDKSDKDLANCTTGEIVTGSNEIQSDCRVRTPGAGGVTPNLLRAVIAVAENTGAEPTVLWNMNSGHFCDYINHPVGRAADLSCRVPSQSNRGDGPSVDKCERMFKYLYDHHDELGLIELIWNVDLPYSKMGDGKHTSYVAGHDDHIHIGVKS